MAVKMKKPDYWPALKEAEVLAQGQKKRDEKRRSLIHKEDCIRIPMIEEARSLNLSNAVAIVALEALRQTGFPHLLRESGRLFEGGRSTHEYV